MKNEGAEKFQQAPEHVSDLSCSEASKKEILENDSSENPKQDYSQSQEIYDWNQLREISQNSIRDNSDMVEEEIFEIDIQQSQPCSPVFRDMNNMMVTTQTDLENADRGQIEALHLYSKSLCENKIEEPSLKKQPFTSNYISRYIIRQENKFRTENVNKQIQNIRANNQKNKFMWSNQRMNMMKKIATPCDRNAPKVMVPQKANPEPVERRTFKKNQSKKNLLQPKTRKVCNNVTCSQKGGVVVSQNFKHGLTENKKSLSQKKPLYSFVVSQRVGTEEEKHSKELESQPQRDKGNSKWIRRTSEKLKIVLDSEISIRNSNLQKKNEYRKIENMPPSSVHPFVRQKSTSNNFLSNLNEPERGVEDHFPETNRSGDIFKRFRLSQKKGQEFEFVNHLAGRLDENKKNTTTKKDLKLDIEPIKEESQKFVVTPIARNDFRMDFPKPTIEAYRQNERMKKINQQKKNNQRKKLTSEFEIIKRNRNENIMQSKSKPQGQSFHKVDPLHQTGKVTREIVKPDLIIQPYRFPVTTPKISYNNFMSAKNSPSHWYERPITFNQNQFGVQNDANISRKKQTSKFFPHEHPVLQERASEGTKVTPSEGSNNRLGSHHQRKVST